MKYIILVLIIPLVSANLEISEILPNPIGSDEFEYIEIYNPTTKVVSLENYSLRNTKKTIFLNRTYKEIAPSMYLLFYKNKTNLRLKNKGPETIQLYEQDRLRDECNYTHTKEGFSWSKINATWILTTPTPLEPIPFQQQERVVSKSTIKNSSKREVRY